jgi:hypothetical protein
MPLLLQPEIEMAEQLFDNCFDPIEAGLRDRAVEASSTTMHSQLVLQAMLEAERDEVLVRSPTPVCRSLLAAIRMALSAIAPQPIRARLR